MFYTYFFQKKKLVMQSEHKKKNTKWNVGEKSVDFR